MKNASSLDGMKLKEIQAIARNAKVSGWHDMRKADLILAVNRQLSRPSGTGPTRKKAVPSTSHAPEVVPDRKKTKINRSEAPSPKGKLSGSRSVTQAVKTTSAKNAEQGTGSAVRSSKKMDSPVPESVSRPQSGPTRKKVAGIASRKSGVPKSAPEVVPSRSIPVPPVLPSPVPDSTRPELHPSSSSQVNSPLNPHLNPLNPHLNPAMTPPMTPPMTTHAMTPQVNPSAVATPLPENSSSSVSVPNEVQQKISVLKQKLLQHKTLGTSSIASTREAADQIILMVRDPFWLHAYWEISPQLVERIRAAMGPLWHTADPVLRLYKVHSDYSGTLRQQYLTDIHIHGGINNWYIDVDDPPSSFMLEIGYLARDGQFFILLTSNIVETPQRYVHEAFGHPDVSWMGIPSDIAMGGPARDSLFGEVGRKKFVTRPESLDEEESEDRIPAFPDPTRSITLEVDAELVIKGKTDPGVQLAIKGGNIRLKEDGTFSIRYHLPERRHVFPVVATSRDGLETQTIILAVERNTKVLDTVLADEGEE